MAMSDHDPTRKTKMLSTDDEKKKRIAKVARATDRTRPGRVAEPKEETQKQCQQHVTNEPSSETFGNDKTSVSNSPV